MKKKFLDKSTKLYKLVEKRTNNVLDIYKDKNSKHRIISAHYLVSEKGDSVKVSLVMFYEGEEGEALERYTHKILGDICPEKHDVDIFDEYVKVYDGQTAVMASVLIK